MAVSIATYVPYITKASEAERARLLATPTFYNMDKAFAKRKYIEKRDMAYPVFTNNTDGVQAHGGAILRDISTQLKRVEQSSAWNKDKLRSKALDNAKKEKARYRDIKRGGLIDRSGKSKRFVLDMDD